MSVMAIHLRNSVPKSVEYGKKIGQAYAQIFRTTE
jgi:hypothetical protein